MINISVKKRFKKTRVRAHLLFRIKSIKDFHFNVGIATRVRIGLHVARPIVDEILNAVHSFDCRFGRHTSLGYAGRVLEWQEPLGTGFIRSEFTARDAVALQIGRSEGEVMGQTTTLHDMAG